MCADRKRCGMIGTYEYGKIIKCSEKIGYGLENMLINEFNCLYFVLNLSSVTAFIGSFNMDIYKIRTVFEFINCGFALSVKVCINVTCCTFNIKALHACTNCNAFEKVNSRNHTAFLAKLAEETIKSRFCTLTPKPD